MSRSHVLTVLFALVGLVGCGGENAATSGSAAASSPPKTSAASSVAVTSSASAAPVEPPAPKTQGEVEMRDKKKVAFSIELPEGLKDVSEPGRAVLRYAKDAKSYEGYSFQVMEANPKWVDGGLDKLVEEAETSPEAKKNQAKVLDKGTTEDGFFFASSIVEGKKKAVVSVGVVKKGEAKLMCRGNVEGPLAEEPEKAAAVLVKTCKSLKIGS